VERILLSSPTEADAGVERANCDAAVVMSHNYDQDVMHLRALLAAGVAYIGVLGPRRRTQRMLEELGVSAKDAASLHAPAGLDIGAETANEIALAIVAEVQAVMTGRRGAPLRERTDAIHSQSPAGRPGKTALDSAAGCRR
jgi:xanthine/CO dehydrogenase XdhC/CoxF family maturation factor